MSYAALWCKSHFSFLEGASSPEELVAEAHRLGLKAMALTDRDGVYGLVRAHVAAKERRMQLIVGSEITIQDGHTLLLLVRNEEGYRELCALISMGRLRSPKGECRVDWSEVTARYRGLSAIVPVVLGFDTDPPWADLKQAFGSELYLGYAKHRIFEDVAVAKKVRQLENQFAFPVLALPEILYHHRVRRPLQDVLTCIRNRTSLEHAGKLLQPNDRFAIEDPEEFLQLYSDSPQAVENTRILAERCRFTLDEIHYRYPSEEPPQGYDESTWLESLVRQGALKRYPQGIPMAVEGQIRKELETISTLEYGGYFLTMREIVRFCRENSILCQGRGSAANSIVCYCLGITAVDPVQMDLLFERFLSLERAEPPDIDLDIEHQRREEVIQHMYAKYGRDRAAMVANVIRYRPKSAIRDVGKALGFSSVALERISKNLGAWWVDFGQSLDESLGVEPEFSDDQEDLSVDRKTLLRHLAGEILDFPRHLSIHPGGFLLGSRPIAHLVPVENATMPDRTVIQWDKYDVEAMNLFKVDLLGLGALSHLDHAMRLLKKHRDIDVSLADISAAGDDPEVYEALGRGDTVGVFQVESRAQMAMLPRLKPKRFYDLVIEVSIVRPGPISGGMVHPYLRRRSGEEPVHYPHPSLEPILKKTLGVPIFQEQVMKLAVAAADYSPGEADQLRRDMAAWRSSGKIAHHKERLINRMVAKGIKREFAEGVYSQIQGFGEYGFPESHAASFALIAYATAWFKVKHPAFFTCGLLNAWPMGFYSPATIVDDAKRHRIPILPIDVRISDWDCRPEWVPSAWRWGVRMGLRYVKGLRRTEGEAVETLKDRNLESIDEFASLSGLSIKAMKALVLSGAFVGMNNTRRSQLWQSLGGGKDQSVSWGYEEKDPVDFSSLDFMERIDWDYAGSLHSTQGHPLEPLRDQLSQAGFPDSEAVRQLKHGSCCSYVGLVICRQRPGTANGVLFLTLEDEAGFVNLVVWEKIYQRYREFILTKPYLGVRGRIQSKDGTVHLMVDDCFEPPVSVSASIPGSRDFH